MDTIRGSLFKLFGVLGPFSYFIPAPFGKHHRTSRLNIDGRKAWIIQEIMGPVTFMYYVYLGMSSLHAAALTNWQWLSCIMFVGHYLNRAIIWPLFIMPSISPSHMSVLSCKVLASR